MRSNFYKSSMLVALLVAGAEPALAHHVMDGQMPQTFAQGLLSGLGHPVIGIDHLAAIVGVGLIAAMLGRGFAPALAFSAAMIAGVVVHLAALDIPAAEMLVGLSTAALGLLVAFRMTSGVALMTGLFALTGLVHGYALGESMVGAEPAPLGAYLAGLLVMQTLIAAGAYAAAPALSASALRPALVGATGLLIAVVGGVTAASAAGLVG